MSQARSPRSGDHVEVDWGLSAVTGTVSDVRRVGPRTYVLVTIDVLGLNDEVLKQQTVSLPSEVVRVLAR